MVKQIAIAALLLALGVAMGAFGAHGLKDRLDAYHMAVYEKAVLYHLLHALGILAVAAAGAGIPALQPAFGRVCLLLLIGIVVFSGSLYALALTGVRGFGAITPIGGLAFISGWVLLGYYCLVYKP